MIGNIFRYLEPLWVGPNKRISLRRTLSILFSINLVINVTRAIAKFEAGKTYGDMGMILGIEAGLITALLSLTTYSNSLTFKQNGSGNSQQNINSTSKD